MVPERGESAMAKRAWHQRPWLEQAAGTHVLNGRYEEERVNWK